MAGNKNEITEKGRLGVAFRAVSRRSLLRDFAQAAAPVLTDVVSLQAQAHFERAAQRLQRHEAAFSARPRAEALTLLKHLRSAEHMKALRDFSAAKEALFDENPHQAPAVTQRVLRSLMNTAGQAPRRSAASPSV